MPELYPQVLYVSIPRGQLLLGSDNRQLGMDKFAFRRMKLEQLIKTLYGGKSASLARATGIDASYISRMRYPDDKPGRKRIGDDIIEKIDNVHPGWLRDGTLAQIEFFLQGMSEEHKDALLDYANHLYIKDNPSDRRANPFPEAPQRKKESAKH